MRVELVRLDDEQAIGRADFQATMSDRMRAHDITIDFGNLEFERAGTYEFRLFANNRYATVDVVQRLRQGQG